MAPKLCTCTRLVVRLAASDSLNFGLLVLEIEHTACVYNRSRYSTVRGEELRVTHWTSWHDSTDESSEQN